MIKGNFYQLEYFNNYIFVGFVVTSTINYFHLTKKIYNLFEKYLENLILFLLISEWNEELVLQLCVILFFVSMYTIYWVEY